MKKTALLGAAAFALMATPAMAQSGYVGLGYGNGSVDTGTETDLDAWFGQAAGAWEVGQLGFQANGSFGSIEPDGGDSIDYWTLGGHLWLTHGQWRFGGVVATTQLDAGGGGDADEWSYGAETRYDFGRATASGSVTWGTSDAGGPDIDTFNVDFGGNIFPMDNVRLGGSVGFGNLDGGGSDVDTMSYGVNGEYLFTSLPVSVFAGWNMFEIDDADVDGNFFTIGARWNFGTSSLLARSQSGPSWTASTGYLGRFYGAH